MTPFDRYLLLASLSFFFACLAVSLISVYYRDPAPASYMYSPQLDPAQSAPLENSTRQYAANVVPKSVLHYPANPVKAQTVECYLEEEYKKIVDVRVQKGAALIARAEMEEDRLEIYAEENGKFFAFIIGPDAIDQMEACEVAAGTGWKLLQR